MLIAVPLVVTMAVGLVVGLRLVGQGNASVKLSAQGTGAAGATPPATGTASPATTASTSPTATASATAAPAAAAAANVSCDIIVPSNPLSAQGLSTPYQLTGPNGMTPQASGCTMANSANLGAFVQATILDPATGRLSTYEPLVVTQGTQPAAAPVLPALPAGAVVTLDFGFNGTNLTLQGATGAALGQGRCVNGLAGSIFGQVSFCNGVAFFAAANKDIAAGLTTVPALGTASKAAGVTCPTTRSFTMIDQDQSDNVTTQYLVNANGQTAQDNAANTAALTGANVINNGSDNALLNAFLDPTLGCTPFTAPDLTNGGTPGTSQALDELFAAKDQAAPIALVPENDPMTLVNGAFSQQKTNRYRTSVDQPAVIRAQTADTPAGYCQNMVNVQSLFLQNNQALLATGTSPVPGVGTNLFTFLANRLNMSFTNLNCQNFGLRNPVRVTLDGNGAATAATIDATQQAAASMTGPAGPAEPGSPGQAQARPEPRPHVTESLPGRLPAVRRPHRARMRRGKGQGNFASGTTPACRPGAGDEGGDHSSPVSYSR